MDLNLKQAYSVMLNMLDTYYWETKNDDLGAMLGFMSTDILEGDEPADSAVWDTWKDCATSITNDEFLSSEQAFAITLAFLNIYNQEFGFNIKDIITKIIDSSENDAKWVKGINKVLTTQQNG